MPKRIDYTFDAGGNTSPLCPYGAKLMVTARRVAEVGGIGC
jgi:hypothetical protein